MSEQELIIQKLNRTVLGQFDNELVDGLEDVETLDEDGFTSDTAQRESISIEGESIITRLDAESAGLELNRYETASIMQSINNDESVLIVKDTNLDRVVEAHVLDQDRVINPNQRSELIHEALILSGLDHPGIPPIYDLNIATNDLVYCTLKHVEGFPLSALCVKRNEHLDEEVLIHDTVSEIVANFIKITEVMHYAHDAQVIHRNIKPEHLIVGDYGQVYVTAWGHAFDMQRDEADFDIIRGTPLYMSPEQVRCENIDPRSDIYSIGACLFYVLFKRPHMIRDDLDDFLDARRNAVIDDTKDVESIMATRPLLEICKRCLAPLEERYQSVDALHHDLKEFQNQQIIERFKEDAHLVAGSKSAVKWLLAAMVLIAVMAWFAYDAYAKQYAAWGAPVYSEQFAVDTTWQDDWSRISGSFEMQSGERVVTKNGPAFIWFYKQRLHGGVAIEFEGEILADAPPGDLSIIYAPDPNDNILKGKKPPQIYYLQHGAVGNVCSMIEGPRGRLDYTTQSLEAGVRYKIRGEIEGKQLHLYLDGVLLCSYELLFPLTSGYIGLYAYYDGKAFDNISVYNRELPKVTNIVKTGDLLYEHGLYQPALERYQRIMQLHKDTELGLEGLYKSGLCYYHMGEVERAFEVWEPLEQSEYFAQINFYRWKELELRSDYHELLRQMYAFYRSADAKLRVQIREQWGIFLYQVRVNGWKELTREFLRFRNKNFPDDQIFSGETYAALKLLDMPDKALELFPEQPKYVTSALSEIGDFQKILDGDLSHSSVAWALLANNKNQKVIDEFKDLPDAHCAALIQLGRFNEARQLFSESPKQMQAILMATAAYDEVIQRYPDTRIAAIAIMLRDDNPQALIDFNPREAVRSTHGYDAITGVFLQRYHENDKKVIADMYEKAASVNYFEAVDPGVRFCQVLLPDILAHLSGEPEALQRTLDAIWTERKQIFHMRHWHNVGLLLGNIDKKAYLAQPFKRQALSEYYFYAAIHHDLNGETAEALNLYRKYQALPLHQRRFNKMISFKKFVSIRVSALTKQ